MQYSMYYSNVLIHCNPWLISGLFFLALGYIVSENKTVNDSIIVAHSERNIDINLQNLALILKYYE